MCVHISLYVYMYIFRNNTITKEFMPKVYFIAFTKKYCIVVEMLAFYIYQYASNSGETFISTIVESFNYVDHIERRLCRKS